MNLHKFVALHKLASSKHKETASSANFATKIQARLSASPTFKNAKLQDISATTDTNSIASATFEISNSKGIELESVDLELLNKLSNTFECKWYLKPISPKAISLYFQEYT